MQKIIFDLSKNEAEIKSVDGEIAEGNVGSVELHIINAPDDWDGKTVWATFIKGEVELPCITSKENNEYVTPVPDYVFIDDRNFGIYVWCVGGQNYIETRRVLRIPVAETGTFSGETVKPETISSVDQLLGAMQTLATTVENAEKDRYQKYGTAEADRYDKYYKAEGLTEEEIASDDFESREMKFLRKEGDRQTAYGMAEKKRDDDYSGAESSRYNRYSSAEADRNGRYVVAEAERRNQFDSAESERNSAESVRQTNEKSRQSFEGQRRIAESSRKNAETVRQSNETERQTNENARQEAELKRKETIDSLAKVATSGSFNDLTDKPFSNVNWLDIDSLYGREKDGIYKVSGKEMSGTVGMGNSSSYMLVMTNVSGNVLQTCQYLIHSDGKSQYRLGTGTDIEDWSEWKSVGVTSYNDLTDKPITILAGYPDTEDKLNELIDGIYCYSDISTAPPSNVFVIASHTEDWFYIDEDDVGKGDYKREQWTQVIIDDKGVRKRQKTNCRNFADGTQDYTIDWAYVPLNDDLATKAYVDSAIGDIETSLENIIEKYGLGGESE